MNGKWLWVVGAATCVGLIVWHSAPSLFEKPAASRVGAVLAPAPGRVVTDKQTTLPMSGVRFDSRASPDLPVTSGTKLGNLLESAPDLRAVFEAQMASKDPLARNIAYRAWSACFPTFISPQGQPVSLDRLLAAMPANAADNAARGAAYRSLHQRCEGFFRMSREETVRTTNQQQDAWNKGDALAPGELAVKLLREGEAERAYALARSVVLSRDAYAIASLQDFIHAQLLLQRDSDTQRGTERADLRSLAYAIAACQLGLECGQASLTALRLCANGGQCEGTVVERLLQTLPNAIDRETVMMQSQQISNAIQSGNTQALGLSAPPG